MDENEERKLFSEFFDEKGVKPGFAGMGNFRGRRDYTTEELIVINHFFTNAHSNIYCATDNMPNELWALLMGQYARSDLTARDRLLQLFREVKQKDKTGRVLSLEEFADMINKQGDVRETLSTHLVRAGKFIEEFGIDYGHASLRDSGTIRACFEGVTQRVTKLIEAPREGAYQEQSTRATLFTIDNIAIPFDIRRTSFEGEMLTLDEELIDLYNKTFDEAQVFLAGKYQYLRGETDERIKTELGDLNAKLPDSIWGSVVKEKAFDLARSLLPQNITTSLGITLNTRRFQDILTEWQSSSLTEMRLLGRATQLEASKISSILVKYGKRSSYYANLPVIQRESFGKIVGRRENFWMGETALESRLITHTPEIEDLVLASILFQGSDGSRFLGELKDIVSDLGDLERRKIAKSYVEGKKPEDIFPKMAEVGSFTFERIYDIGAFRDLQRQRGDRQQVGAYSVVGYHIRPEIDEMGLGDEFRGMMDKVKQLYDRLKSAGYDESAEYVPVMANTIRHITTKDPVQCFYEAQLRTQPAGADSYREIAKMEIEEILEVMPSFKGLIPYDSNKYPLNRLPEKVRAFIKKQKDKLAKN